MTQQPLYVIHWRSGITGATGCGTGCFPADEAQRYADALNADTERRVLKLTHWIKLEAVLANTGRAPGEG